MNAFLRYSQYYDLIYQDKPYEKEVSYIFEILTENGVAKLDGLSINEIGCGSGKHAIEIAKLGGSVTGYDLSETMVKLAHDRLKKENKSIISKLKFINGKWPGAPIASLDIVLSLFHVVSYHTSDEELEYLFRNVSLSLRSGGFFLFDYWFGPAVRALKPELRYQKYQNDEVEVVRIASPNHDEVNQIVTVNYDIFVTQDGTSNLYERIREQHKLRYFDNEDFEKLAQSFGLEIVSVYGWGTKTSPNSDTWAACMLIRKL
jgi:SAM-dependent methyltransferase|tara:strand:- start:230 stop:1009 length:780 start_codon:yes stop_codon:yes gene_type:complete